MLSPQLRAYPLFRMLSVFIDAWADHNWSLWDTQLIIEGDRELGWNEDNTSRQLKQWGAKDQHGIYQAAGLTKRQTECAFMFYDRQLEPSEIGKYLRLDAHTVRVHLQAAEERLRRLAA